MEIDATGKDVRTGESFERELGTVCTPSDRTYLRSNTRLLHGTQYQVDDMHGIGFYLLLHIIILVFHLGSDSTFSVFLIHRLHAVLDESLAILKTLSVMVTDDV